MRILMYSHDSYGLGHLRRTLALAESFVAGNAGASVLILTGSTVSGTFRMSPGIDLVKLPSAVKVANGEYESSRMKVTFNSLKKLRSNLILSATETFDPDAFLVDKAPLGMKREVYPALSLLRQERPSTLTVLGLRDVMDEPWRIRRNWREGGIVEAIEELYDIVLIYGPREVYDPLPEYGLSESTLERCRYVGYIGRSPTLEENADRGFGAGYVLVTAGGGADGFFLIKNYLDSLRGRKPSFESIVVTGPLMDDDSRREIETLSRGLRVRVTDFQTDMENLIREAGAVVSMGGYNTTIELLAARKAALIVPRVEPRLEQLIRAERLSQLGLVEMIHPNDLTPARMREKVEALLARDPGSFGQVSVDLSGARRAVETIRAGIARKRTLAVGA
ncbi:MAG TPA: glycosyltransferase [Rubrobacteraceae bacterium]|nr:glycosyltransferase [Rubrobacteraceae bacterium]